MKCQIILAVLLAIAILNFSEASPTWKLFKKPYKTYKHIEYVNPIYSLGELTRYSNGYNYGYGGSRGYGLGGYGLESYGSGSYGLGEINDY